MQRIFAKAWVELSIGAVIIVSVALTLTEFAMSTATQETYGWLNVIQQVNFALTCFFVVELFARFLGVLSLRRFTSEYWIDILAVFPSLLEEFYTARLMRLIRLLRILRLFGFLSRVSSNFPYILRRGAVEYVTVGGMLIITVLLGTGATLLFESDKLSAEEALWFSIYSLFAGEPVGHDPATFGGRVVAVFVMFMGLTIFAMFTGTVSAFMVERLRTKGRVVDWDQIRDHIVICGWNSKAEIILQEYRASHLSDETPIVVIHKWDQDPPQVSASLQAQVRFLEDDFTRVPVLEKAGIHRATTCIILADTGGRTEQDADARTILAALTVEKLNPDVYTCAELNNRDYASHLKMGHVNDYVVSSEYSAYVLAQAAMNRGLMGVFNELLTYQRGNQFYRLDIPDSWSNRDFGELFTELREEHGAILVAVTNREDGVTVNPRQYIFRPGDEAVVIAEKEISLK